MKQDLWLCYVDNTLILWNHGTDNSKQFLSHINNQNLAIHFIIELENPGSLPFLDVTVEHNNLRFTEHRKETHRSVSAITQNHSIRPRLVL